jgi:Zn-dependent protease with chaperone function
MGVLLSVPTESVAIRVIVASVAAALLGRLLLRVGLRVPGVRAAIALVPAAALIVVVAICWTSLRLPLLMLPVDAVDALPVPVRDTYLHFAPMAIPILLGLWGSVAAVRISLRYRSVRAARRRSLSSLDLPADAPVRVRTIVAATAAEMRLPVPPIAVVPACPGGASAIGIRRPLLVLDDALVMSMDDEELQGVVAHELAHVRRRDNLVSLLLGIVRDLFFFVPGGRWALRQLHTERELAADQLAVRTTRRPGALASGLLKVIDAGRPTPGCAAFMPSGTLVGRVQHLIEEQPPVTRLRGGVEVVAVATALSLAVLAAMEVPSLVAGAAGDRDAVALVWASTPEAVAEVTTPVEARAFQVYRRSRLAKPATPTPRPPIVDDDPGEVTRAALYACAAEESSGCPETQRRTALPLQPRPTIRVDDRLVDRWVRATPVVSSGENGLGVYWLQRQAREERLG